MRIKKKAKSRLRFKQRTNDNGKYKSKLEETVARSLPKRAVYESERINYVLPKKYIPDFVVPMPKGRSIYIEVKGYLRYEDQAKMRAVKNVNPNLDIRFVFSREGKVQGSKMTNVEWCKKYDFPYCIGLPPKEWWV